MSVSYQLETSAAVKGLARLFGDDMPSLWKKYPMTRTPSIQDHPFGSQLKSVLDENQDNNLYETPVIKRLLYRPHQIRKVHRGEKMVQFESTGAEWHAFSAQPSDSPATAFDMLEIGGTLNGDRKAIEAWRRDPPSESQQTAWSRYVDNTLEWYDQFRTGLDGKPGTFEQVRKTYQLPQDAKVVWLLDLDPLTKVPIEESTYWTLLGKRLDSFKSYYGESTPVFLCMKTDYVLPQKTRDTILGIQTPKTEGEDRLVNLGFTRSDAQNFQIELKSPTPASFSKIYEKVQAALDEDLGVGRVVGGGSLFEPSHYRELVKSVLGVVGAPYGGR